MVLYERQEMSNETFSDGDEAERCAESWVNGNLSFVREWVEAHVDRRAFSVDVVSHCSVIRNISMAEAWRRFDRLMDQS